MVPRFTTLLKEAACVAISLSLVFVLVITGVLLVCMEWGPRRLFGSIAYRVIASMACLFGRTRI